MLNLMKIKPEDIKEWEYEINLYNQMNEEISLLDYADPKTKYEIEMVSEYLLNRAYLMEKNITNTLFDIVDGESRFMELENRIKGKKRLCEKIYKKVFFSDKDIIEVSNKIGDVIRYTIIVDENDYVSIVDKYLHDLEEAGFTVIKFKNRFREEYCHGISVNLVNDEGLRFEIQFHTPTSYYIKEMVSREPYKVARNFLAPKKLLIKADLLRKYYQAQVPYPNDVLNYEFISNIKRKIK